MKNDDVSQALIELGKQMYDNRNYSLKTLAISSRIFNYWKSNEVLPWFPKFVTAKFNLIEAAWLLVLEECRKMGLSLELMKTLTSQLIIDAYEKNVAKEVIEQEIKEKSSDKAVTNALKAILSSKELMEGLRSEISYFSQLVKRTILYKAEGGIIISQAQDAFVYEEDDFRDKVKLITLLSSTHILIPIKPILSRLFEIEFKSGHFSIPFLTDDEEMILKTFRHSDTDKIIIKKKGKNVNIEIEKGKELSEAALAKALLNGEFSSWDNYSVSSRGNKQLFITSKKKIK